MFSTNVGIASTPFLIISIIVSNDKLDSVVWEDASTPDVYCVPSVTFTKPSALLTKDTIEPVPFSIISKTISNEVSVPLI